MKGTILTLIIIVIYLGISTVFYFLIVKSKRKLLVLLWIILYFVITFFYFTLLNDLMETDTFRKMFYDMVDPLTGIVMLFFLCTLIAILNTIAALWVRIEQSE